MARSRPHQLRVSKDLYEKIKRYNPAQSASTNLAAMIIRFDAEETSLADKDIASIDKALAAIAKGSEPLPDKVRLLIALHKRTEKQVAQSAKTIRELDATRSELLEKVKHREHTIAELDERLKRQQTERSQLVNQIREKNIELQKMQDRQRECLDDPVYRKWRSCCLAATFIAAAVLGLSVFLALKVF